MMFWTDLISSGKRTPEDRDQEYANMIESLTGYSVDSIQPVD